MTIAEELKQWVGDSVAWNLPSYFNFRRAYAWRNQYGRTYVFQDGSRAYVAKGSAKVEVRS